MKNPGTAPAPRAAGGRRARSTTSTEDYRRALALIDPALRRYSRPRWRELEALITVAVERYSAALGR